VAGVVGAAGRGAEGGLRAGSGELDPAEDVGEKVLNRLEGPDQALELAFQTTGGDEEFLQGKYWAFLRAVPHLYSTVLKRITLDHHGFEPYYAVHHKGVHIISLHNPDNYGEADRSPEFAGYDLFRHDHPSRQQQRWLVEQLTEIRQRRGDQSPIIILSHRPVYNQSRYLVELFDRYRVDLVLGGNFHIYARAQSRHTLYLVTGIVGETVIDREWL
jgi:hypothetical protein